MSGFDRVNRNELVKEKSSHSGRYRFIALRATANMIAKKLNHMAMDEG